MARTEFLTLPENVSTPVEELPTALAYIARHGNEVRDGKTNNVGEFTIPAGQTSIIVPEPLCSPLSYVGLMPRGLAASALVHFITPGVEQFTVNASSLAAIWGQMEKTTDDSYLSSPGSPTRIDNYQTSGQSLYTGGVVPNLSTGELTLNFTGSYVINTSIRFEAANNTLYNIWLAGNGLFTPGNAISFEFMTRGGGDTLSGGGSLLINATAGDTVALYIENTSVGTDDVYSASLSAHMIGKGEAIPTNEDAEFRYVVVG